MKGVLAQASGSPSLSVPKTSKITDPLSEIGSWPRQGINLMKIGITSETLGNCKQQHALDVKTQCSRMLQSTKRNLPTQTLSPGD